MGSENFEFWIHLLSSVDVYLQLGVKINQKMDSGNSKTYGFYNGFGSTDQILRIWADLVRRLLLLACKIF